MSEIVQVLVDHWKYDLEMFSQTWFYTWLLVPFIGYLVFFVLKWIVITVPFWLPLKMVVGGFRSSIEVKKVANECSKQ